MLPALSHVTRIRYIYYIYIYPLVNLHLRKRETPWVWGSKPTVWTLLLAALCNAVKLVCNASLWEALRGRGEREKVFAPSSPPELPTKTYTHARLHFAATFCSSKVCPGIQFAQGTKSRVQQHRSVMGSHEGWERERETCGPNRTGERGHLRYVTVVLIWNLLPALGEESWRA